MSGYLDVGVFASCSPAYDPTYSGHLCPQTGCSQLVWKIQQDPRSLELHRAYGTDECLVLPVCCL